MAALRMQITSWAEVALEKRELKTLMRSAGADIAAKTRRLISQSTGSGRYYAGGGGSAYRGSYRAEPYYASAPGQPPVRVTGTLRGSLRVYPYPEGTGFAVRERAFYALFLEAGAHSGGNPYGGQPAVAARARARARRHRARGRYQARVLLPRPSLDLVMAAEEPTLEKRVKEALDRGVTWRETKHG
jgi:hypothetical protein